MHRMLFAALVIAASSRTMTGAHAQESESPPAKSKDRTFKLAEPSRKAAVGTQVVPAPRLGAPLKRWALNASGASAMGVTAFVREIQLFPDGRVRFYFNFWNKGREAQNIYFDFDRTFVADEESNRLEHVGQQYQNNHGISRMLTVTSDSRVEFWQDYKAPTSPCSKLKIGILLEHRYDHRADAFKPFLITLQEPLFFDNGVFQEEKAAEVQGGDAAIPGAAGGMVPPANTTRPENVPASRGMGADGQKFRNLSEKGLRLDGAIRTSGGSNGSCRMVFSRMPRSELVKVKLVNTTKSTASLIPDIELAGAFLEVDSAPSGIALKMVDKNMVEFTFFIEGNNISGKDSSGNQYTFVIPKK